MLMRPSCRTGCFPPPRPFPNRGKPRTGTALRAVFRGLLPLRLAAWGGGGGGGPPPPPPLPLRRG
ncbi:hypothetical protein GCM10010271_23010 [Streptomyces kurssanovii]|nr:hypothetical protein GCM10010271_23010 [Streptomyces kurssanovii]